VENVARLPALRFEIADSTESNTPWPRSTFTAVTSLVNIWQTVRLVWACQPLQQPPVELVGLPGLYGLVVMSSDSSLAVLAVSMSTSDWAPLCCRLSPPSTVVGTQLPWYLAIASA
jgi:hypothetical protein